MVMASSSSPFAARSVSGCRGNDGVEAQVELPGCIEALRQVTRLVDDVDQLLLALHELRQQREGRLALGDGDGASVDGRQALAIHEIGLDPGVGIGSGPAL